jgi:hypothetical protein
VLWQEVLDFNLVVFSPYKDLTTLLKDAQAAALAECAWCACSRPRLLATGGRYPLLP